MDGILLTIAIPTYKRAGLLDTCLLYLTSQLTPEIKGRIELIVSDNASPDNTKQIVEKYIDKGFSIQYFRNSENIGGDRNIAACFLKASGRYVWVFSDDDFILPGRLKLLFDILNKGDYGNIFVNTLSFTGEYVPDTNIPDSVKYTVYDQPVEFVKRVNYWSTFLTGNIVNKSLFNNYEYVEGFCNTLLVQLCWVLPIIFAGKPNLVVDDQIVACLANNMAPYNLYEVFAKNYNIMLDALIAKNLIDKKAKAITNKNLLESFFPMFLHTTVLKNDNALNILIPIYWSYPYFWFKMFPALIKKQWLKG